MRAASVQQPAFFASLPLKKKKLSKLGRGLKGRILGLVGMGPIAVAMVPIAKGFGMTVRTTTTHPLVAGECATRIREQGALISSGTLTQVEYIAAFGEGLNAAKCQQLLGILRTVRNEQPAQRKGWFAKLVGSRT